MDFQSSDLLYLYKLKRLGECELTATLLTTLPYD